MTPAKMRYYMGFVYVGGAFLWLAVGIKKALPWWVVVLAIVFCFVRAAMAFRRR